MQRLGLFFVLTGCTMESSSGPTPQVVESRVRATIKAEADGQAVDGVGTLPRKTSQTITFNLPPKTKYLLLKTCHRDVPLDSPPNPFRYTFAPAFLLENDGSCAVIAKAITAEGKERLGIIDWSGTERGEALLNCNGARFKATGASSCQSRAGLIQSVWFDTKTIVETQSGCNEPYSNDGFRWFYQVTQGWCVYLYQSANGQQHRHSSWGYIDAALD